MTGNTNEIITRLRAIIDAALAPHRPAGKFALLDFPNHANVGDSAIWLGEIEFFRERWGRAPAYVCEESIFSADEMRRAVPEGPLFLHGGGNFGDLWPAHQDFREKVIARFHDRPIVQLPQSLHFRDPARLKRAVEIINAHPDFTLFVRDHQSLALARENFTCTIKMCPDMAFWLGMIEKPVRASMPLLCLLRTDVEMNAEAATGYANLPPDALIADWLDEEPDLYGIIRKRIRPRLPFTMGLRALDRNSRREVLYRRLAEHRVMRGLKQLASAEFIITDRLHTHIMSLLMDIPHVVLDNNYGKISKFIDAWTKDGTVFRATKKMDEAVAAYQSREPRR